MHGKILIVDDEAAIRALVRMTLHKADYACIEASGVNEARRCIVRDPPDLVLLDWMLPEISGADYARQLRREPLTRHLPIIMLTARSAEDDKIRGLDSGVDDYVTKPFSPRELLARIKALLRRAAPLAAEISLTVGTLVLDPASHRVTGGGIPIDLGPTEFRLLRFFMSHPDRVQSRSRVLDQVWGPNVYVDERTVDVHIRRLRKALGMSGHDRLIQTVRGAGYRFSPGQG
ncbi:MAG: phosphate regulon transcriptional regulator PhoB [Acidiferrobacteraceae bacterium]